MREYSNIITLSKNKRGCYSLDPIIGCSEGMKNNSLGCYGDCYAANYSKRYGYDFSISQLRDFECEQHRIEIINSINKINMPFVRMGTSGDPSIDWDHTVYIIKSIQMCNKAIILVTKHWSTLTKKQLELLSDIGVCINTSISALDCDKLIEHRLTQYKKLKFYCKSVLRVMTCDFNVDNPEGKRLAIIQDNLLDNEDIIDTVFRVSGNNEYVVSGIINTTDSIFMGKKCLVSKHNRKTHIGYCNKCPEVCGAVGCNRNKQLKMFEVNK